MTPATLSAFASLLMGAIFLFSSVAIPFSGDPGGFLFPLTQLAVSITSVIVVSYRNSQVCKRLGVILDRLSLAHLFLIALSIRLAWVVTSDVEQTSDFHNFDQIAREFLDEGFFFQPAGVPVGATLIFSWIYRLFGTNPLYPQLMLGLASTLQVLLIYKLAAVCTANRRAASVSALVLALYPEHFLYTNLLGTDVLFSTLVCAAVVVLGMNIPYGLHGLRVSPAAAFLSGALLGAAHWIRLTTPLFVLASLLFLLLRPDRNLRARLGEGLFLCLGFAITVSPIAAFNHSTIGVLSINSSHTSGWSLLVGTNLASRGMFNMADYRLYQQEMRKRGGPKKGEHDALFADRVARNMGLMRIAANPLPIVKMAVIEKVPRLWARPAMLGWSVETSRLAPIKTIVYMLAAGWHGLIVALAWTALLLRGWMGSVRWDASQIYLWGALLTTVAHALLEVQPRYHHMFLPLLCLCVGWLWILCESGIQSVRHGSPYKPMQF
jgi:hypothetical protein